MKFQPPFTLLCAAACLCFAACSPAPDEDQDQPVAGPANSPAGDGNESAGTGPDSNPSGTASTNPLAQRLRLPDMTGLPTDKELTSKPKPDTGGSGVIARPPSE